MSKLFYDHLLVLDDLEKQINKITDSKEEREELWGLVDEVVHHKVLGCIMDNLPKEHHQEFLSLFEKTPYDESLIDYLKAKTNKNIEELIKTEIGELAYEVLSEIQNKK
ncbi:hypothetical protein HY045_02200 [Candidatus Woesebacteria bacterium]|nr:hypothetical protein [Candidatus Woesebacteria bacterium]